MTVKTILRHKGTAVSTIEPEASISRAAHWLCLKKIGALVVTKGKGRKISNSCFFYSRQGFRSTQDLAELARALSRVGKRRDALRGASTITQQLAKNLYLSPSRNPSRKFRELLITRLLEGALTKRRILELYLNVVEWGDGVYGADAAARTYFRVSAAGLSPEQAALLAGSLINPRRYSPGSPPRRLRQRQAIILRRMRGGGALASTAPRAPAARTAAPPEETAAELETLDEDPETTPDEAEKPAPPDSTAPRPPAKDPS